MKGGPEKWDGVEGGGGDSLKGKKWGGGTPCTSYSLLALYSLPGIC